jgi:hypothetical protein
MNTWARKSFKVGVLAAGGLLFAGTAANAATINSIGNSGFLTGNQVNATVQAPIDVCGNGVGVLGFGAGGCQGGSWATLGDDNTTLNSIGNTGLGVGNQVNATVQAPIDVCGNGVGVAGVGVAGCQGGSWATIGGGNGGGSNGGGYNYTSTSTSKAKSHAKKNTSHVTESTTLTSVGNNGAGVGNQANAVVQIPIDVCGNAVGVLGAAQASCQGGASATDNGGGNTNLTSGFNAGFLTGNQANALVQIPINVCGNAVGVLGGASASCQGGSSATIGNGGGGNGGGGNGGGGNGGYGYGGGAPGSSESSMVKPAKVKHNNMGGSNMGGGDACSPTLNSFGNSGLLTGNQLNAVVQAPIEISGNAVGVLGAAFASSQGGAWASC